MKVLIIDDSPWAVEAVRIELAKLGAESTSFRPKIDDPRTFVSQLTEYLIDNRPNLTLLDGHLWDWFEGSEFVEALKKVNIPFVGFCHCREHNKLLEEMGAIGSINKNDLCCSDGIDTKKLKEKLRKFL